MINSTAPRPQLRRRCAVAPQNSNHQVKATVGGVGALFRLDASGSDVARPEWSAVVGNPARHVTAFVLAIIQQNRRRFWPINPRFH